MLYNLLDRLKFSLPEKPILWKFGGMVGPAVDLDKARPEMPLVIERAD